MSATVHAAVADAMAAEGVTGVAGVLGDAILDWAASLEARGIPFRSVRHEAAAVAMADGAARATGRVGVCGVTCGPGLTHAATSLAVAARRRSPVVAFVGDTPRRHRDMGGIQELDQRAFTRACGAGFVALRDAATVADDVRAAFDLARATSGPVVLDAPVDVQRDALPTPWSYAPTAPSAAGVARLQPDPAGVRAAAGLLAAATRPVVVLGRETVTASAVAAALHLADRSGALLATTVDALGLADGTPWSLGVVGPFLHAGPEALCGDADLLIAAGADLSAFPADVAAFGGAPVVALGAAGDVEPGRPADAHVPGDLGAVLAALAAAVPGAEGFRTPEVRARLAVDHRAEEIRRHPAPDDGRIDPRALCAALDERLPDDCTVVIGAAHFWSFPTMGLRGRPGRRFLHTHDFGCIGQALPIGLGVALAQPDRPVVVVEGDGGFLQHAQEVDTAVRHGLPVLAVVLDDDGLGAEAHKLTARGLDPSAGWIPTPDLGALARALGADGWCTDRLDAALAAVDAFRADPRPGVLDARVSRGVLSRSYRGRQSGR